MSENRPRVQASYRRQTGRSKGKNTGIEPGGASSQTSPSRDGGGEKASFFEIASTAGFPMDTHRQDTLVVEEVGESWLRCRWSISAKTHERALSTMGREVHRSSRVLRLFRIQQDDSGPRCKELLQEFPLPPSSEEWFIHVPATEHAWGVEIGMTFGKDRFFSMLHSVPVTLNGSRATLQGAQRYLGSERFLDNLDGGEPPVVKVQGTFLLNGTTHPNARTKIDDQNVPVDPQTGGFEWKLPLSNGRVVVPMSVVNGGKTQRALLAIDLNFHLLEPESTSDH